MPFRITLPPVRRVKTRIWDELDNAFDMTDRTLADRVYTLCLEFSTLQANDTESVHGLSKALVAKYGEISIRVIRRVWDYYLAYSDLTEIPNNDYGIFGRGDWQKALLTVVARRLHVSLCRSQLESALSN